MKRALVTIIILAYTAFSFLLVFQVIRMDHAHMASACPLGAIIGTECPGDASTMGMISHHISAITGMTYAIIPAAIICAAVLYVLSLVSVPAALLGPPRIGNVERARRWLRSVLWRITSRKQFVAWLLRRNKLNILFAYQWV